MDIERKPGVYLIVNQANGGVYAGSSVNLLSRWWCHRSDLRKGKHNNEHLQRAWNKYGEDAFVFLVVDYVGKAALFAAEQDLIDQCRLDGAYLYNNRMYAPTNRNLRQSLEQRRKLSERMRGKRLSDEAYRNSLRTQRRLRQDPEYLASVARKLNSPKAIAKRSAARQGKPQPRKIIEAVNSPESVRRRTLSRISKKPIVRLRSPDGEIYEVQDFTALVRDLGLPDKWANQLADFVRGK